MPRLEPDDPLGIAGPNTIDALWRIVFAEQAWLSAHARERAQLSTNIWNQVIIMVLLIGLFASAADAGFGVSDIVMSVLILVDVFLLFKIVSKASRLISHKERLNRALTTLADIGRQVGNDGLAKRGYDPGDWWREIDRASR